MTTAPQPRKIAMAALGCGGTGILNFCATQYDLWVAAMLATGDPFLAIVSRPYGSDADLAGNCSVFLYSLHDLHPTARDLLFFWRALDRVAGEV